MMEQGHIHRNGVYKPRDWRDTRHGNNVRIASVCAPCCPERCVEEGGRTRPQGGGGVDHPTKVQQRKAQTDRVFFCTPLGISYPFYDSLGTIFDFSMYSDISLSSIVRPYWSSTWLSSFHSAGYVNLDNYVLDYDFWDLFGYGFEWIGYDIVSDDDLKFYDIL